MFTLKRAAHYGSNREKNTGGLLNWLADRGCESLNEFKNIMIGVIEWHRRYSEGVGLAPVADDAFTNQPFAQRVPVGGNSDRELRPTPPFFTGCDDSEIPWCTVIQQKLQVTGQRYALSPQTLHAGFVEDLHRGPQDGQTNN